jgi:hypothetical protein
LGIVIAQDCKLFTRRFFNGINTFISYKNKAEPKGAIPATSYFLPPKIGHHFGRITLIQCKSNRTLCNGIAWGTAQCINRTDKFIVLARTAVINTPSRTLNRCRQRLHLDED